MQKEFRRFIDKVSKQEGCWIWTAAKYRGGYGHFRRMVDGKWKMYKAHRYSYEVFNGEISKGMLVCHTCDNPSCVNPDHLFLGTHKDNSQDKVKKGRQPIIRNPKFNNMTREIVEQIRKAHREGKTYNELMKQFNTSRAQISRICTFKTWK